MRIAVNGADDRSWTAYLVPLRVSGTGLSLPAAISRLRGNLQQRFDDGGLTGNQLKEAQQAIDTWAKQVAEALVPIVEEGHDGSP